MTWTIFYLTCFLVGVTLSVLSFLSGSFHLPHFHPHIPHAHLGHTGAAHSGSQGPGNSANELPFVNFGTVCAFLAWFGGTGYLLTRYSSLVVAAVAGLAFVAGVAGAGVVFWFVARVLLAHEHELDPADYDRVGVLARITSPIREGGTGEIVFSQGGTRQTCGARSENGLALPKATEVVVTRYERGIAYVRAWDELAQESQGAIDN